MPVDFDTSRPIYLQITEAFTRKIIAGEYACGARVASVRELALSFGVNPNTMQRALAELEREGLLYTERTAGRFVTTDEARIHAVRTALAQQMLAQFTATMADMGFDAPALIAMLEQTRTDSALAPTHTTPKEETAHE